MAFPAKRCQISRQTLHFKIKDDETGCSSSQKETDKRGQATDKNNQTTCSKKKHACVCEREREIKKESVFL